MVENYAFWDLIAEEAYRPKNNQLKLNDYSKFCKEAPHKKIYMFGCNNAAKAFCEEADCRENIVAFLDNAENKWGMEYCNIPIKSPSEVLPALTSDDLIIICMRLNADAVAAQIEKYGFYNNFSLGVLVSGMEPYKSWVEIIDQEKDKPLQDYIMMESTNDFDGNSGELYTYLKRIGTKYRFIWIIKELKHKVLLPDKNDIALCPRESIEDLKEYMRLRAVSKWQIWDNYPLRKVRDDQINVFLQHFGMGYKQVKDIVTTPAYVNYVLSPNETVYKIVRESFVYGPDTKVIFGGLPRNDVLFEEGHNELAKITDKKYKKAVMWAPTLRKSRLWDRADSDIDYPLGISLIYTVSDMEKVNEKLRELDMLLVLKIHPRQRIDFAEKDYSNIIYLDGDSIKKVHSYRLMAEMDAMISDYSSIVFDYMLLDRPIAWVIEDIDHYKIVFLPEKPLELMPGPKITNLEGLFLFLEDVSNSVDSWKEERNRISKIYNADDKGTGCKKLVEKLGL